MIGGKIGNKKYTRKDFERVKKMDRNQFEIFCKELYEQGQQSVLDSQKQIDFDDVKEVLMEVKGIGAKRADQIMEALKRRIEGKKADE